MLSILEELYVFPPLRVPQTDDEGIELWKSLLGMSDLAESVPIAFLHPCPTCRTIAYKRPVENFFVQELVHYFRDTV